MPFMCQSTSTANPPDNGISGNYTNAGFYGDYMLWSFGSPIIQWFMQRGLLSGKQRHSYVAGLSDVDMLSAVSMTITSVTLVVISSVTYAQFAYTQIGGYSLNTNMYVTITGMQNGVNDIVNGRITAVGAGTFNVLNNSNTNESGSTCIGYVSILVASGPTAYDLTQPEWSVPAATNFAAFRLIQRYPMPTSSVCVEFLELQEAT